MPHSAAPPLLDATVCPLCAQPNRCAMERERETGQPQPPCWCTQVDFQREVLSRVPAEARGQACICNSCAGGPTDR